MISYLRRKWKVKRLKIYLNKVTKQILIDTADGRQITVDLPVDIEMQDALFAIQSPAVREIIEAIL